jgi:hypothetical protein
MRKRVFTHPINFRTALTPQPSSTAFAASSRGPLRLMT